MKKLLVSLTCLLLGLAILSGCGAVTVTYGYSFRFGQDADNEEGLLEYYKYKVSADEQTSFSKDTLPALNIEDSSSYEVWIYKLGVSKYRVNTKLKLNGNYLFTKSDGTVYDSGAFSDEVNGTAAFTVNATDFVTDSFEKTFLKTFYNSDTDAPGGYKTVKYSYKISGTYNDGVMVSQLVDIPLEGDGESARADVGNDKNLNFSVELERYADNETFFIMLRLQDIDTAFSDSFAIADPFNAIAPAKMWDVKAVYDAENPDTRTLENRDIDGFSQQENEVVDCIRLNADMRGNNKGQTLRMFFTKKLSYTYSAINSLGTVEKNTYQTDLQLLIEFAQEGFLFSLSEYKNHALK